MIPLLETLRPVPTRLLHTLQPLKKSTQFGVRMLASCPLTLRNRLLQPLLNQALRHLIEEGELDFLRNRICGIQWVDHDLHCLISFDGKQLLMLNDTPAEVTIRSSSEGFLKLVTQQVDPDTLFFRRELQIEGDVELGLFIKNMLDALDTNDLPVLYRKAITTLRQLASLEASQP